MKPHTQSSDTTEASNGDRTTCTGRPPRAAQPSRDTHLTHNVPSSAERQAPAAQASQATRTAPAAVAPPVTDAATTAPPHDTQPSAARPTDAQPSDTADPSLWSSPQYRSWFTADTASAVGAALKGFAIALIAFSLCGSVVMAGWVTTAAAIAGQVTGLFGGTVVDRHNRKRLVIVNAAAGAVLWGVITVLLAAGALPFALFATLVVAVSAINGLLGGATNALLRSIVEPVAYPKAQTTNQARDSVIQLAGSPLGGLLYAVTPWLPFAAAALMYAISGVSATRIAVSERIRERLTDKASRPSFVHDFTAGWAWVMRRRRVVIMIVIASLINFGINGVIGVAELHLVGTGTDSVRIGVWNAVAGVGMLIGALIASKLVTRVSVGGGVLLLSVVEPLTLLPLLFTDSYPAILLSTLLVALPVPLASALLSGFMFTKTPQEMQGRLGSVVNVMATLPMAFCSALAGQLLASFGFAVAVAVFMAVLAANVVIVLAAPSVRRLPAADRWAQTEL